MADKPEPFLKVEDLNLHEVGKVWRSVDVDLVGRFLRVHLVVERYVEEHLQQHNPNLGSIAEAKLGFFNKVMLLNPDTFMVGMLIPGLLRLNKLRNQFAHHLDYQLTEADVANLVPDGLLQKYEEPWLRLHDVSPGSKLPIHTVEAFGEFACAMLRTGTLFAAKQELQLKDLREERIKLEAIRQNLDEQRELLDELRSLSGRPRHGRDAHHRVGLQLFE